MLKNLLFVVAAICLLASCRERRSPAADTIVTATVTNTGGARLDMAFNNTRGTVAIVFKGETINLKQDTMASGIRYSNPDYVFSEWHGQIALLKAGDTVFTNIQDKSHR
jgi:membrane-bound inhibitor of C-type lysozyme